jgi:hypothetical protein
MNRRASISKLTRVSFEIDHGQFEIDHGRCQKRCLVFGADKNEAFVTYKSEASFLKTNEIWQNILKISI